MPEVAIIIPTFNQARYIGSTIKTVQQQTFSDWELLVVDDGSTDKTNEIVRGFLDDPRIHYIKQQNKERAAARNTGVKKSSAPYIAFLDADDLWHPEKLAKQLRALRAQPDAGLCYTLADTIDRDGKRLQKSYHWRAYSGRVFDELLRSNFITNSSVLLPRSSLLNVGLFDSLLPVFGSEDWDLWLRVARQYSVCLVDEELTLYRVYPENTSTEQVLKSGLAVVEKLYSGVERLSDSRVTRSQARAYLYLLAARLGTMLSKSARTRLLMLGVQNSPTCVLSLWGVDAVGRIFLPSLTSIIKRWVWRLKHWCTTGTL